METDKQDNTPAQGVKLDLTGLVKPLVWEVTFSEIPRHAINALTSVGMFVVVQDFVGMNVAVWWYSGQVFDTIEAAKAAAQADYTARILAALDTDAIAAVVGALALYRQSSALQDVAAERNRQVRAEGWDDIHDDCHDRSELALAAACYALSGTPKDESIFIHGRWYSPRDLFWPWDKEWWKPSDSRRNLVKAGALLLAEIERLDRAALARLGVTE
jgi:hypothetical protein